MKRSLVVVESPAKARTIKKYLGKNFTVKASVGHIKDLPKSKIGVDVTKDFEPEYVVIRTKAKVIKELKEAAEEADQVYLAPDPDREGEAIAWHIAEEIRDKNPRIFRVLFNEITKKGVTNALKQPTELDIQRFESQQARRILDRLVGYQISPVLWQKVKRGLSAGRVQSVAVRIIVEREREIAAFKPEEYWTVECRLEGKSPPPFVARLVRIGEAKAEPKIAGEAEALSEELRKGKFVVESVEKKERKRNAPAPFTTSKLQQEAARKLRFTAKKTMALAQRLYEGIEVGDEGPVGLITYMRTDSTRLSDDAVTEVRAYIAERYGAEYVPPQPLAYKSGKLAQGAHEAIRPTSTEYEPEKVRQMILDALAKKKGKDEEDKRDVEDAVKLYTLIWNRFVACQMKAAIYDQTTVDVKVGRLGLRATGQVLKFPGYMAVYVESSEESGEPDPEKKDDKDATLPPLVAGEECKLLEVMPEQHFTQPPPRFTEASLVKELEEQGIGRPSTYTTILSTIQDRGYSEKREGRFFPTELGTLVNDLLVKAFPDILNVDFTAKMEEDLDRVEEGQVRWVELLKRFYDPFKIDLDRAVAEMRDVKREEIPTEHKCEKCGSQMVIKWGRNGSFLACSGYPECRNTKEFMRREDGSIAIVEEQPVTDVCETCGAPMVKKRGRFGGFLACSRYPECKTTKPISLGVNCPRPGCGGAIAEKRSKRGKPFFGCSNYAKTKCDFVLWDRPVPEPCPQCKAPFLVKKENKQGTRMRCVTEGCGYVKGEAALEGAA